jgi:hypothetical protein
LLEKYSVSDDHSSHTGETAIYYRTLVLDYEPVEKQKLYFLSQKHELLFQIWLYGKTSHPIKTKAKERCFVSTFFFKNSYYICSAFCRNKKWDIIVIHFCLLEFIGILHTTNKIKFLKYFHSSKKRGQISTDLLNQVIQNSRIDQSKQLENSEIRTVEILQKFNIVCRVKKSNELKQTEMYDYYVPFLIPTESTSMVFTNRVLF